MVGGYSYFLTHMRMMNIWVLPKDSWGPATGVKISGGTRKDGTFGTLLVFAPSQEVAAWTPTRAVEENVSDMFATKDQRSLR